ncbi:MAG: methyltransferase domain-containing protein [Pseudomonadales bacterium]
MSVEDRLRWNKRFSEGAYQSRTHPSNLLVHHQELLLPFKTSRAARALDVACGRGRNSKFLIEMGFNVTSVDVSDVALMALSEAQKDSSQLSTICHDFDLGLPEFDIKFDVILKIRFLQQSILPKLCSYLKPNGLLFIEVLMQTEDSISTGPKASRFRITPGALREALADANILHYHEGTITDPDGKTSVVAQAIAQRCE